MIKQVIRVTVGLVLAIDVIGSRPASAQFINIGVGGYDNDGNLDILFTDSHIMWGRSGLL